MNNTHTNKTTEAVHAEYLARLQQAYARALADEDSAGRKQTAQRLYQVYALLGERVLAEKWTQEYLRCLLPPQDEPPGNRGQDEPWSPARGPARAASIPQPVC